jgi:hypothetical protein
MARDPSPSKRCDARRSAKSRRAAKASLREVSFEALAAGWSPRQIADARKVSVKTIRREIDRALDERRLDAPDRYAHLQVARLTKALRLADAMIDRGELNALGPLVKIVAALDRYHGLGHGSPTTRSEPLAIAPAVRTASLPEPPPSLALTHAAPPLDEIASAVVEGSHDEGTDFGA